jgi:hypothetical protein
VAVKTEEDLAAKYQVPVAACLFHKASMQEVVEKIQRLVDKLPPRRAELSADFVHSLCASQDGFAHCPSAKKADRTAPSAGNGNSTGGCGAGSGATGSGAAGMGAGMTGEEALVGHKSIAAKMHVRDRFVSFRFISWWLCILR